MKQFTPTQKIEQARLFIVQHLHFYGSIFFRLAIHEDDSCPTAWTDGRSLGYNPAWLGKWTIPQIVGVFVHEILHVILKHHLREEMASIKQEDHFKWNVACDYALNPTVIKSKNVELPDGCLLDQAKYPDNLAEQIFKDIPKSKVDELTNQMQAGGSGTGPVMPGEVRPFKNGKATQAEKDIESDTIDQWVNAAAMKANNAGSLTGGQQELVRAITAPTVKWEDELQFMCEEISKNDYTWQRPNVRYMQSGVYLPSMTGQQHNDMLFFVDTSGSLTARQLTQIKAEIRDILSSFTIRVIVVYWDTKYQDHEVFEPEDVFDPAWELHVKGRGGTDFEDVLDWMDNKMDTDLDPAAVVFFTDLECSSYPKDEPDLPWLWVQLPDYNGRFDHRYLKYMPNWGRHVTCNIFAGPEGE